MRRLVWLLCGVVGGLILCSVITVLLVHAHDAGDPLAWMLHYRSATGMSCCAAGRDCVLNAITLQGQDGETMLVLVGTVAVRLPRASVHLSENQHSYVCLTDRTRPISQATVRCAFYAIGT